MNTNFTPGPWRIGGGGTVIYGPKTDQRAPVTIAQLLPPTPRVSFEERKANAHLIAAAPDLLHVLEILVEQGYNPHGSTLAAAQKAIQKALGE